LTEATLRRQAADLNSAITSICGYYATNVVGRILASSGSTRVLPNYEDVPGAIPVPATLSIELGRVIGEHQSNITYRFVSDFPFKNRAPHALDSFERKTLAALRQNSDQQFTKVSTSLLSDRVRHIVPIVMGTTCVECHNSDADSPKRDWKVGDVRGIQELSVTQPIVANILSFRYLLVYFLLAGASGLWFITTQSRQTALIRTMNRELERQHQIDRRHLDWLRQLASFLRHEVLQPVAQINSSIELIHVTSGNEGPLQPYIAAASQGAKDVWNLVRTSKPCHRCRGLRSAESAAVHRPSGPSWRASPASAADVLWNPFRPKGLRICPRQAPGALLPPSIRGSARRAIRQLRPMAQSRYYQSLKRPAAPGMSSQAKPEDTLQFPPAGAPAADAISSGTTVASYAASYCATPRGACKLAQRQIVGDRCWCVARAGEYVNGTVASIGYAGN
jgi:hypothetical protein